MYRIRTLFGGDKIILSTNQLSFDYGTATTGTYTESGSVKGYDTMTTVNGQSFYTLYGGNAYTTNLAVWNFKTTKANQQVTIRLASSSEAKDYMCCAKLDTDSITEVYAKSNSTSYTNVSMTVPTAGDHYVKFFFRNDGASTANNNEGYFYPVPFTNQINTVGSVTTTITLTAQNTWSVSSKPSWITLNTSSGDKGTYNITVTAASNSGAARSGNIVFINRKNEQYIIAVSQSAPTTRVETSKSVIYGTQEAGSETVKVNLFGNNTSWTASKSGSHISISPTSGNSGGNITISWTDNTTSSRTGSVTITGNSSGSASVSIIQEKFTCSCDQQNHCTCDCATKCTADYSNACTAKTTCKPNCNCDCQSQCTTDYCYDCDSETYCSGDCNYYSWCSWHCFCDCNGYSCSCGSKQTCTDCASKSTCTDCGGYSWCSADKCNSVCNSDCRNEQPYCKRNCSPDCSCDCNWFQHCMPYDCGGCPIYNEDGLDCDCDTYGCWDQRCWPVCCQYQSGNYSQWACTCDCASKCTNDCTCDCNNYCCDGNEDYSSGCTCDCNSNCRSECDCDCNNYCTDASNACNSKQTCSSHCTCDCKTQCTTDGCASDCAAKNTCACNNYTGIS